ncbi:MAG TPA: protein kinase family protein, partial [Planctomycetota bacterium]|nr:protein kinase family protein [Planctomycetota bacterium]
LLSGAPPFAGTGYMLVARHLRDRPASLVPRGVPKDLDALVLRLLAKRPDDRPPTATAVAEELESLLGEKPPSRSARAPWIAIPILLGAALVAGVFFGTHREPTEAPRPPTVTPPPPPRVFKDRYHAALEGWNEGELETATGQADTAVTASAILSMALSGDGRVLLTAGEDATVKRWDPGKTTPASTRMNFQSPVVGIAFVDTQGPNPAVLSLERHHGLKLWRLTGDRVIGFLDPMSKDEGATGLVVGGKDRLAIASNGRDAPSFYCAIEPESPGVFQGWSWLRVRVPGSEWNTGPPVTSYDAAIAGVESFVVAGAVLEAHGLFVRGKPHPTDVDALEEETDPPVAVAFLDAAGDRVLAASEHGVVSLWDIGSKMRVWSYRGLASVTRVAALDEHRALVLSGTRVVVLDADAKDASRVRSSFDLGAADDRPTCVLVDGGARRLWLGTAKGALLRIHLR